MAVNLNLLLIEDDPADVLYFEQMLKQAGVNYALTVIEDGEEAFEYVREIDLLAENLRPHFIILDLNLPKKNGLEILTEIRQFPALQAIPVAILSTSEDPKDKSKASEQKAMYITKPPSPDNFLPLLETVKRACQDAVGDQAIL